jgi:hypothetical protein
LLRVQPWLDHVAVWNKNGRPAVFTSQPYGLCWEALCGLVDFCRQNGLEAKVDASGSWHYPGSTVLIAVVRACGESADDLDIPLLSISGEQVSR